MKLLTKDEFTRRAVEQFGYRFKYNLSKYRGADSRIKVWCSQHGWLHQVARRHLSSKGCPQCRKPTKVLTQAEFIDRCRGLHGDRYSYATTIYTGMASPIEVTCKQHGPFQIRAASFVQRGTTETKCPECYRQWNASRCAMSTDEFVAKAKEVHGDRYLYSKTEYRSHRYKVVVTCKVHGDFHQDPSNHLSGHGCPMCAHDATGDRTRLQQDDFLRKARAKHGDAYGYELARYTRYGDKATIRCPEHGYFTQIVADHLDGHGCPACGTQIAPGAPALPFDTFEARARLVHGDEYQYDREAFSTVRSKVRIKCEQHGWFEQVGANHLNGTGCPFCSISVPHRELLQVIKSLEVSHTSNDRSGIVGYGKSGMPLESDIYLPDHGIAIEVNGLYWHSSASPAACDRDWLVNHQYRKQVQAEANGVRLVHYYEDEILHKQPIVRSHLLNILDLQTTKIMARKTQIVDVGWRQAKDFYDQHHLQGAGRPADTKGLVSNGELVAVMSCGKSVAHRHRAKADEIELIRFASSVRVVGGASKLLTAFIREYNPQSVVSYSDNRISQGRLYRSLGFSCDREVPPDYMYVEQGVRRHKSNYTRAKLRERWADFDENLTEEANCANHRIFKIYNCGLKKWVLTL